MRCTRLLAGSGWREYQRSRSFAAFALPDGLSNRRSCRPILLGYQGRNRTRREHFVGRGSLGIGTETLNPVREVSLALYGAAATPLPPKGAYTRRHKIRIRQARRR